MKTCKVTIIIAACLFMLKTNAQEIILPGSAIIQQQWLKNNVYELNWYMLRDTTKIEIAKVKKMIVVTPETITIVTRVNLKQSDMLWIDSSVAANHTLLPVKHSSYNQQRDMTLNFGNVVTGYYFDKASKKQTDINTPVNKPYFDSNIYPDIIQWLPLAIGYKAKIPVFDYNPKGAMAVVNAFIKDVKKASIKDTKGSLKNIWLVTVFDEISNGISTYYINQADRSLLKIEIDLGGRKMVMEKVNN